MVVANINKLKLETEALLSFTFKLLFNINIKVIVRKHSLEKHNQKVI
jgi:hypothetical protein